MKALLISMTIIIVLIFLGLLSLAIIYDGVYIQLVFDFGIMLVSGLIGYYIKASGQK